ncbi:MAG TPA: HNH endonuclease signature motif containing protein [Anaerolineae bacterium]|nr:HNH endonuclease signature motif containing protein [Anaerolineae bacterium]
MRPTLPPALRDQVRAISHGVCAYCRSLEELSVTAFEIDHIIPLSAGGASELDNLCLACTACNRLKGSRQEAIDLTTGAVSPLFHPYRHSWFDHFRWNQDQTEIVGLTPTGRATVHALQMNRPQLVRLRRLWRRLGYRLA